MAGGGGLREGVIAKGGGWTEDAVRVCQLVLLVYGTYLCFCGGSGIGGVCGVGGGGWGGTYHWLLHPAKATRVPRAMQHPDLTSKPTSRQECRGQVSGQADALALQRGPQYGQAAVSALGSGRACPATVIAFCPWCQFSALLLSVRRAGARPLTLPPLATLALRALGLCVHTGEGSLPPCVANLAGPIRPQLVGLVWGLRLKNPVGSGLVKVSLHTTCNIQGVKQRDPSVLHDTVEGVEGEAGAESSERAPCDEDEKFSLRGRGGSLPSIATSSSDASSCTDAWGDIGENGWGVRNVVRVGPTW